MKEAVKQRAKRSAQSLQAWSKLLWRHINDDNMTTLAGNLAYVSLLSLVPLIAVIFALFAVFPMFSDISIQLRHFIFANFIPTTGDVIQNYIEQFVANSTKMTAVGACGLAEYHLAQHPRAPACLLICRLLDDPDPRPAAGRGKSGNQLLSVVAALGE